MKTPSKKIRKRFVQFEKNISISNEINYLMFLDAQNVPNALPTNIT